MARERGRVAWPRWLLYAAALGAAFWLLWAGRRVWFPLAVAFVIAMVLDPLVDRLEARGFRRVAATAFVFLVFIAVAGLAVVALTPTLSEQTGAMARDLGRLFPDPEHPSLLPIARRVLAKLDAAPVLRDALLHAAQQGTLHLQHTLNRGSELILLWAPNLAWFLIVPVLAFYLLIDFHRIYAKTVLLVPPDHRQFAQTLIAETSALFGKYLRGLAFLCLCVGISCAGVLFLLKSPYWQVLGLLAGLLYAVPMVGSVFTVALAVLVTLVTDPNPLKALLVGGCLTALISGLFDQVIVPRVMGRQVGLHPVLTILALLLGYELGGIVGMLVAVPLAALIQIIILHLVPKLGAELKLRPLHELKQTEAETQREHLRADEQPLDDHAFLNVVVENADPDTPSTDAEERHADEVLPYAA